LASTRPPRGEEDGELLPGLNSVPGVARIAAGAWYRAAVWSLSTTLAFTGKALGVAERAAPDDALEAIRPQEEDPDGRREDRARSLRERGGELLDRAADVHADNDPVHPGFARIIDQLAPDEARILKLLINEGPQGIVYVNKAAPFGFGAREIARRLSMIGHEAGCLHNELVPAYLDNLVSHGLVAIRRDALDDELPYQVIEAQPEVIEALQSAGGTIFRGQITRRSVHLTDFGRAFCQVCFPTEHLTGEFEAIEFDQRLDVAAVTPPDGPQD
jgi:abortive infection alpha-like protein